MLNSHKERMNNIKFPEIAEFHLETLLFFQKNMLKIYNSLVLRQINFLNAYSPSGIKSF